MSFTNLYYKRATGTPRACYVCYKPTTVCLATANTTDFLYSCEAHLNDRGFATRIEDPKPEAGDAKKGGLSAEEIAQVKAEWEEQQRKKKEKAKEKAKEKEANDGDKAKDGAEASEAKDAKPKSPPATPSATTPVATMPGLAPSGTTAPLAHERFALHRDIFALRQAEHRKRRQTAEAKKLVPRLPAAPSGGFAS